MRPALLVAAPFPQSISFDHHAISVNFPRQNCVFTHVLFGYSSCRGWQTVRSDFD
jgi:hypothetical protein